MSAKDAHAASRPSVAGTELALPPRVVKLGGSLLDQPDWPRRWQSWFRRQEPRATVLVVGGGPWADTVRHWDQQFQLGECYCHDLCGKLLSLTASVATELLTRSLANDPRVHGCVSLGEIRAGLESLATRESSQSTPPPLWILDAGRYLLRESPHDELPLPRDWTVTSDSIAADVAWRLQAAELVLLKSCRPGTAMEESFEQDVSSRAWPTLASLGQVDEYFPTLAPRLARVRWVDLSRE